MTALGQYIKQQIEQHESDKRFSTLRKLPENTFQAIYDQFIHDEFAGGVTYNGVYYSEWEIYFASHDRDSDAEVLL
ncbi:TPA: hypothetical protein PXM37_002747 [Yersinia enterocolitica]|nr:hypothetical protein [Yersinia enterocolitica]HDL6982567.1 hypothetical protein [Yersinia enterocolitica]HDL7066386.1 hypothetical protein [Yersinia enterocolitica]HDL7070772.1 hypothetical protein [Yersinia enterocolitica]